MFSVFRKKYTKSVNKNGGKKASTHRHGNRCVWHSSTHMPTNTRTTPLRRSVPARCVGLQHFSAPTVFSLPALCARFPSKKVLHTRVREIDEGKRGFRVLLARFSNTQLNLTTNNVKFLYLRHIFHTASALTQCSRTQADRFFLLFQPFLLSFRFSLSGKLHETHSRRRHSRWSFYGCVFDGLRLAWTWLTTFRYISGQAALLSDRAAHLNSPNGDPRLTWTRVGLSVSSICQ